MWLTNVIIKDKEIQNERLELTDKDSLYFIGPKLTLKNCTVVLKVSARNLLIIGANFINCTFEVKRTLVNHQQWVFASLKGCRFKGRLSGCEFGRWPGYADGWENGAIEDCDFSEAELNGCRFHGCDPRTIRFPRWPCFTILDPIRRSRDLMTMKWPGYLSILASSPASWPPSSVAVTWSATILAKEEQITPEEIKAVIERCGGIRF